MVGEMPLPLMRNADKPVPPALCESPRYLRALADAYEEFDDRRSHPTGEMDRTIQRDLRFWADEIERLCHA